MAGLMILKLPWVGFGVPRAPQPLQNSHLSSRTGASSEFVAMSVGGGVSQALPPPPFNVLVCVAPGELRLGTSQ